MTQESIQLSPLQRRLLDLASTAYLRDSLAADKDVSGWGWRKLYLVQAGQALAALGLVEIMYTGTGNIWYRSTGSNRG